MSHNDYIETALHRLSRSAAYTDNCPVAAMELPRKEPVCASSSIRKCCTRRKARRCCTTLSYNVCGCKGDWKMDSFVETSVKALREKIGDGKVLCALSGGVDSSVAAVHALQGRRQAADLRIRRPRPAAQERGGRGLRSVFGPNGQFELNFIRVNARQRFYDKLAGVTEPETKRKIIGEEFIRVFEEEAKKIGAVDFLVQGTIYPDVVESGLGGESTVIKSHHNVGGLPDYVDFKEIVEPLR